ncbi:hypothetical protein [Chitinasiproducens palmae]|uniref:Uncharacterized protein n=1 Tax=Chitinasiproducens palmae TaxID=1770053 RepID=A0A1H2PWY1_9BURK|nr:hypothetical protein [Chitinasiproducens palmae]SDV51562.1 hypothetical protein SAMN05216551_11864 [Chitinasiproducens palmae]
MSARRSYSPFRAVNHVASADGFSKLRLSTVVVAKARRGDAKRFEAACPILPIHPILRIHPIDTDARMFTLGGRVSGVAAHRCDRQASCDSNRVTNHAGMTLPQ